MEGYNRKGINKLINIKKDSMKISVVIPVYNEVKTISEIVSKVKEVEIEKDIIIIDDGSTDGTRELLKSEIENDSLCRVFYHQKNMGKGASIRTGLQHITGDIVIIQDADLEYDPKEYPKLIKPIIENRADVVYGSRFMGSSEHRILFFWHYVANKILTTISNMFTNLNLTDMETCYKVFRKEVIKDIKIKQNRFGFEPEITAKIAKNKCRVYEIGISYYGRDYKEGKKINWKDAFIALWCILKYKFID